MACDIDNARDKHVCDELHTMMSESIRSAHTAASNGRRRWRAKKRRRREGGSHTHTHTKRTANRSAATGVGASNADDAIAAATVAVSTFAGRASVIELTQKSRFGAGTRFTLCRIKNQHTTPPARRVSVCVAVR